MQCKKCHIKLLDYIEGGLNSIEKQAVSAHLKECKSCSEFVDFLKSTLNIIQEEKQIQPDTFFYSRIMAGIGSVSPGGQKKHNFLLPRWIPSVAAGLVLLIGVLGGLGLGKVLTPAEYPNESEISGFVYLINDFETEPIENFLFEL